MLTHQDDGPGDSLPASARQADVRHGDEGGSEVAATIPRGIPGAIMLFAPENIAPAGFDPVSTGVAGSLTLSFAVLAVFGFRAPLKFLPILFIQLIYKSLWLAVTAAGSLDSMERPAPLRSTKQ